MVLDTTSVRMKKEQQDHLSPADTILKELLTTEEQAIKSYPRTMP